MRRFKDKFCIFDITAEGPKLMIDGKPKLKTSFGGFISLIAVVFVGIYLAVQMVAMLTH
jgi:hypothetical protein